MHTRTRTPRGVIPRGNPGIPDAKPFIKVLSSRSSEDVHRPMVARRDTPNHVVPHDILTTKLQTKWISMPLSPSASNRRARRIDKNWWPLPFLACSTAAKGGVEIRKMFKRTLAPPGIIIRPQKVDIGHYKRYFCFWSGGFPNFTRTGGKSAS